VIEINPVLDVGTVGSDGTYTTIVQIPSDLAPGSYTLQATGTGLDGGARVLTCPTVVVPDATTTTTSAPATTGGSTTGGTTTGGTTTGGTSTGGTTVGGTTGGTTTGGTTAGGTSTGGTTPAGTATGGTTTGGTPIGGTTGGSGVGDYFDNSGIGDPSVDSDGDGIPDYVEVRLGTNPNDRNSVPALLTDADGDGFTDIVEAAWGSNPNDPNSVPDDQRDSDGDGMSDLREISTGRNWLRSDLTSATVAGKTLQRSLSTANPAPPAPPGRARGVAFTGADVVPMSVFALGLALLGTAFVLISRRRSQDSE
jgi:hypothetical protein